MLPHKEHLFYVIETCIEEIHKINPDKWITSKVIESLFTAINDHAVYAVGIDLGAKTISMVAGDFGFEISKKLLSHTGYILNLSTLFTKMNTLLGVKFDALRWDDLFHSILQIFTQEVKKIKEDRKGRKSHSEFS